MENIDVENDALERFWVVVADAHQARFLHGVNSRAELREFGSLSNEDARKQGGDIDTDGPGRRSDGGQGHRSAMQANPVEHKKRDFARRVADWLDDQRANNRFDKVSIIAAPSFLGDLRNNMSAPLKHCVIDELDKNLTGQKPQDIQNALARLHE